MSRRLEQSALFYLLSCLIPGAGVDVLVVSGASSRKTPVHKKNSGDSVFNYQKNIHEKYL